MPVDPWMAAQVPPEQVPVQQLLSAEHWPPVATHCWVEHVPLSQRLVQQSVLLAHAPLAPAHSTTTFSQTPFSVQVP